MAETEYSTGGDGAPATTAPTDYKDKNIPPARAALVKRWCERVKEDKKHHEKAFKRMRQCQKIAAQGSEDDGWIESDNYVVPIVNRLVNQAVATLYARNPRAVAKRKDKLLYQLWDGSMESLQQAMIAATPAPVMNPAGQPMVDATGAPMMSQPDPNAVALLKEVQAAKTELLMYDRLAKTMCLLFEHYLDEQDTGYREQIKACVRRTKVCGVSYIELGFQRQMGHDPDIDARIADTSDQIARIEALAQQMAGGDIDEEHAKVEELRLLLQDLQSKSEIIIREGPTLSFPRATDIIPDKRCYHLKTFAGARWVTREFHMLPDEVLETYGIELKKGDYTPYKTDKTAFTPGDNATGNEMACVWRIQDKRAGQVLTVIDGYCDFVKEPAEPDVKIERFWTLFPIVFNEVESDDDLFPPSDVWNSRHMQREYNSARQGLREHRIASRPRYVAPKGRLEDKDKDKLSIARAHEIVEIDALGPDGDISKILVRVPTEPIDPTLYETESVFVDVQRSVGTQEANLGGTSNATATETSIAENSRMAASADNVDDLDTALTQLARAMGQLMLLELSIDTVREIAGPGAVWPEMPPRRAEIAKDLHLTIEAGSSGRPNKAAELANLERAAPWLVQIPGLNPVPFLKKGLDLLDLDMEDAIVEGMPSIVAMNQMMGKPQPMGNAPGDQGAEGADNRPKPGGDEPGAQPAFPAPVPGTAPAGI